MNQQPQEQPKVKELKKERNYTIKPSGEIVMIETTSTEITFTARQLISFKRQYDKGIEDIKNKMSKETIDKMKKHNSKLEEELKPIIPIFEEAEKIIKKQQIEMQKTQTISQLKHWLNQKEVNTNALAAIWSQVPKEHKEEILTGLSKDEKSKLLNLKLETMKSKRGKQ